MSTWINVARYHLVNRLSYVLLPWALLAFVFAVNLIIGVAEGAGPNPTKALAAIYVYFFAIGAFSISRSLPFGLALGVSRRSYYIGTAGLALTLAVIYGLALTGLQALERATGDWGVSLHFFQVSYILAGPWYLTWLTSLTGLVLLFTYGMWFGLVHRRWGGTGLIVFVVGQITVVLAVELTSGRNHAWPTLSAAGLTGVLAAVAAVLLAGGYAVIRRVRV